jgi:ribosomal protein S18 acetylase RimI-like enzyme
MSKLPLRIRDFLEDDLETLCEIDRLCFPEGIAFTRAEFILHLNHPMSITRVCERLGTILGFVMAQIEMPSCAHVITLDVIPSARKLCIGTVLMETLHRELRQRGIALSILEVSVKNLPAKRLYKKLKYQYLETLYGYYNGREDACRMVRTLGINRSDPGRQ